MNNPQVHFAKYLDERIWSKERRKSVTLKAVRLNFLIFQDGEPFEESGMFSDFFIIVNDEKEIFENDLPPRMTVKRIENERVIEVAIITPSLFLADIKEHIYSKLGLTDKIMLKNSSNREKRYMEPRQVIMAAYFCAFNMNKQFSDITLNKAGQIYGKDHATVIHSIKKVNQFTSTEIAYKLKYAFVWKKILQVNPNARAILKYI